MPTSEFTGRKTWAPESEILTATGCTRGAITPFWLWPPAAQQIACRIPSPPPPILINGSFFYFFYCSFCKELRSGSSLLTLLFYTSQTSVKFSLSNTSCWRFRHTPRFSSIFCVVRTKTPHEGLGFVHRNRTHPGYRWLVELWREKIDARAFDLSI